MGTVFLSYMDRMELRKINPFCIPSVGAWHGLGPKLTNLLYNRHSVALDLRKKSLMRLYELRRRAVLALGGRCVG